MSTWNLAKKVIAFNSPIGGLITKGVESAAHSISEASSQGIMQLREEVIKQQLLLELAQKQARVDQELAISTRIANAAEVEIEEYYEDSAKGNADIKIDAATQTGGFGLGGEGRKVSKRVYHFKGWRDSEAEQVTQDGED
jgi:hypothetical protein